MTDLLSTWVEELALGLLGGKRFLLRMPPRFGKSHISGLLASELGPSAVHVDGSRFTEANQAAMRLDLEERLSATIENEGSAQLIFDSYDRALLRTQGARLQARLAYLLIDGDLAQDLGALFLARCGTDVHRKSPGSPLMSRVIPIAGPDLSPTEVSQKATLELIDWFGDCGALAAQVLADTTLGPGALADKFELDTSYIQDVRRAALREIEAGTTDERSTYAARSSVRGLMKAGKETLFFARLRSALISDPLNAPSWPENKVASSRKFQNLILDAPRVLWTDRYMYRDIEPLRNFLLSIRANFDGPIYLLGSERVNDRLVSRAEMARINSIPDVEARWMTRQQYVDLHERHLVTGRGGWVVPQVHVIVGAQGAGSAVAAPTSSFGLDYWAIWPTAVAP